MRPDLPQRRLQSREVRFCESKSLMTRKGGLAVVDRVASEATITTCSIERNVATDVLGALPALTRNELTLAEVQEKGKRAPDEDEHARVERKREPFLHLRVGAFWCCARTGRSSREFWLLDESGLAREDVGGHDGTERVRDDRDFASLCFEIGVAAGEEGVDPVALALARKARDQSHGQDNRADGLTTTDFSILVLWLGER